MEYSIRKEINMNIYLEYPYIFDLKGPRMALEAKTLFLSSKRKVIL